MSPASAVPVNVLDEGFTGAPSLPTDWTEDNFPEDATGWTGEDDCADIDGTDCASVTFQPEPDAAGSFTLFSKPFNVNGLTDPVLDFDAFVSDPTYEEGVSEAQSSFSVMATQSNCTTPEESVPALNIHGPFNPGVGFDHYQMSLPARAADYCIRFAYTQFSTSTPATIKIDNVVVSADDPGPPPPDPNDPPVAPASKSLSATEDTPAQLHVPASELNDPNGDPLTLVLTSGPMYGSISNVQFLPGGMFLTYTPPENFDGERNAAGNVFRGDEFKFKVKDDGDLESTETTVTVDMTAVNDAPEIEGPDSVDILQDMPWFAFSNGMPGGGAHCTGAGCSATPDVPLGVWDDAPGQPTATGYELRMIIETSTAAGGTMSLGNTTGLTFSEGDGTDDQRMVFTALWFAIDNALSAGATYKPASGYVGSDTLRLFLDDQGQIGLGGAKFDEKLIAINIGAINHRPTADDKSLTVPEDGSVPVTLSGTDPDGDPLTFDIVTQPGHGDLSGTSPNLTYTPDANYSGSDSFTYTASDAEFTSFIGGTVSITVNGVTDPPVVGPLTFSTFEEFTKTITLTTTSNQDNVPITWEVGPAAVGKLFTNGVLIGTGGTVLSSPDLTYVGAKDYFGPDYFIFRAKATIDGAPFETQWLQGTINVANINDPPVANYQLVTVRPGETVPITLQASDADQDPLTYTFLNQPQVGTLSGTAPNLSYTAPLMGWHTSFTYKVSDAFSSAFGTVEIRVTLAQPDAMIRPADELFSGLGYNIFNTDAAGQTLDVDAPPGQETRIVVDIANRGFFNDRFLVQGAGGPQGWSIKYLYGGQDISSQIYAGKEFDVLRNSSIQLTMSITPPQSFFQPGEIYKALVTAKSLATDGESDAVAANIRVGTFQPDILVSATGRFNAIGNDIYNETGSQQTIDQRGASGQIVYSHFYIQNDGTAVDDFVLKGNVVPGATWLRQISNDTDITSAVEDGTYKVGGLQPGQVADILLVYNVPEDTTGLKTFTLTATSVAKNNTDKAIANIEAFGTGQPDLILESDQRARALFGNWGSGGGDLYNSDGAGQTAYEVLPVNSSNVFAIHFENDSAVTSLYDVVTGIRACLGIDCSKALSYYGAEVRFWELNPRNFTAAEGNREITSAVLGGLQRQGPPKSLVDRFWAEIVTSASTPVNLNLVLSMEARAVGDPTKDDKVIMDLRTVKFRPDVEVANIKGANIYNTTGENQTVDVELGSRDTREVTFTVENDPLGNTVQFQDRMYVTATPESNGFTVRYFGPTGADITSEITSFGYLLRLGALQEVQFKAVVTSPAKANAGTSLPLRFTATSLTSSWTNNDTIGTPGPIDVGGANVRVAYRPDVAVASGSGLAATDVVGDGVYDPLVGAQELAQDAKLLNTKNYTVKLSNDGPAADTLKASLDGNTPGFVLKVFDGTTDVTSALRAATYTTSLPAGGVKDLSVTVRPGERASEGSRLAATFTVRSQTRPLSEQDAARIVTAAVITCDETSIRVGVVDIEGDCLMRTDNGYLSQAPLVLNGVELSLYGPPAIINTARQQLSTDMAEMRFADYAIDTVVRIPVTLDYVVKSLCDEYLYADDWRNGASTCDRAGVQYVGEPLGLSAGEWALTGSVNHLGQEPWGWVFGDRLPSDENPSWMYVLTWLSDGGVKVDVPVPPPAAFNGTPAEHELTLGAPPPDWVEVEFGDLGIPGLEGFGFVDAKYRRNTATDEGFLYGRLLLTQFPLVPGASFGARFSATSETPEWIFAKIKTGLLDSKFPLYPPHVMLDSASFMVEPDGPAFVGYVEADVFDLLNGSTTVSPLGAYGRTFKLPTSFLMSLKGSLAYEAERVSARGELYLVGGIGPLGDAKVTVGSEGVRATMNWNYSIGIGEIDFGGDIGTLDLGRLGFNAVLDGSGSGHAFEVLGSGTLHVFDSNVGLTAVISSIGAAGCATAKISSLGSGDAGVGVKWYDDGAPSFEFVSNCALSEYRDPDAPQHVDFDGFTTRFKARLAEADQIDAFMQSLPTVAPAFMQSTLGL